REPAADLVGGQDLVGDAVLDGAPARAREEHSVLRPGHEAARPSQEPPAGFLLELSPALVGAAEQRNVAGMLEVGLADDPAASMRGAERVGRREAVEAEHAPAAAGELPGRGA